MNDEMKEFKHMIESILDSKLENINYRLGKIDEQTTTVINRVNGLEIQNMLHITNCPYAPKIRSLEDTQLSEKSVKKFMLVTISVTSLIVGIILSLIRIFLGV